MAEGKLDRQLRVARAVGRLLGDGPEVDRGPSGPIGFRWLLIGGLAAGAWSRPRSTLDADILVDPENAGKARQALAGVFPGLELHILTTGDLQLGPEFAEAVFDSARTLSLGGRRVPVAGPAAVVALKLLRGNLMDKADIGRIIRDQGLVDLQPFPLTARQRAAYKKVVREEGLDANEED